MMKKLILTILFGLMMTMMLKATRADAQIGVIVIILTCQQTDSRSALMPTNVDTTDQRIRDLEDCTYSQGNTCAACLEAILSHIGPRTTQQSLTITPVASTGEVPRSQWFTIYYWR